MGTVNFTYDVNGGMITTKGGSNYKSSVTTVIGGIMHLTYYWCPTIPLGTAISNFSAYKQNGTVSLQWLGTIDQNDIIYEIEYSKDNEIGNQPEPSRLDLLRQVLLHNTSINTTLLKLMWAKYTSGSNG